MGSLELIFGTIVIVLAALAVIAVLMFVIVWAVLGIRREFHRDRAVSRFDPSTRYWREHAHVTTVDGIPLADSIVPPPAP
jgi:hypothetical protein